jgi:hypothetical protein
MKNLIRTFKNGVKNLIKWFPIIWKDRDWDQHYIYEVLKFKLQKQAKYISQRGNHLSAQKDARNMNICTSLIQKIQDGYYELEYMNYCIDKTWFEPIKDSYSWEREILDENYDSYFKLYPLIYKKVINDEIKYYDINNVHGSERKERIAMSIAQYNQKRAQDLLFKIMNEQINSWWD